MSLQDDFRRACSAPRGLADDPVFMSKAGAAVQERLTPSEVALARVLGAWEGWPGTSEVESENVDAALLQIADTLIDLGFLEVEADTDRSVLSVHGAALLDRARRAGVL